MPLTSHVADTLDPADYVIAPHVCALDEFKLTNPDGDFVCNITPAYLAKFVAHMAEREALTGDLSPLVIGHTKSGEREIDAPPVVGFARNWHLGTLGNTGRAAAFFDAWVQKDKVDLAKQFPRRSCEVWASRYEADPISLLGATTPARDLGLMKLNRDGSYTFYSPDSGVLEMPEDEKKTEKPAPDKKETGAAKEGDGKLDQILALLTTLCDKMGGAAAPAGAGAEATPGAPGAPEGQMGDQEYQQLLQELMQGQGQPANTPRTPAEEPPVKNQRDENAEKLAALQSEVSRMRVREALVKLQREGKDVNPDDDALIADLSAVPDDMRNRMLDRLAKFSRTIPGQPSFHLDTALASALPGGSKGKRITSAEEQKGLIKLAREKGMDFGAFLRSEGYDVN